MTTKGGVVLLCCWLMMLSAVFMGCSSTEVGDNVLTTNETVVVSGVDNTYEIVKADGSTWWHTFFFGLGSPGRPVQTDTPLTLGAFGQASWVYGCFNGKLEWAPLAPSIILTHAIAQVRFNSTDSYYRLQITENSTDVYIQFENFPPTCTPGVAGTPIHFAFPSSFSHNHLHEPTTAAVVRQVVDA